MWDLALSSNGDLILSGANDLAGISGTDLIEQRIRLRLRLHRGEWEGDADDRLGSQLYRLAGMSPVKAQQVAPAYVRDALRDMSDEITIGDVRIAYDTRSITLTVGYSVLSDLGATAEEDAQQIEIQIPAGGTA